jgi:hypothetical protein
MSIITIEVLPSPLDLAVGNTLGARVRSGEASTGLANTGCRTDVLARLDPRELQYNLSGTY